MKLELRAGNVIVSQHKKNQVELLIQTPQSVALLNMSRREFSDFVQHSIDYLRATEQ